MCNINPYKAYRTHIVLSFMKEKLLIFINILSAEESSPAHARHAAEMRVAESSKIISKATEKLRLAATLTAKMSLR